MKKALKIENDQSIKKFFMSISSEQTIKLVR